VHREVLAEKGHQAVEEGFLWQVRSGEGKGTPRRLLLRHLNLLRSLEHLPPVEKRRAGLLQRLLRRK
jgi:hypothetical protein